MLTALRLGKQGFITVFSTASASSTDQREIQDNSRADDIISLLFLEVFRLQYFVGNESLLRLMKEHLDYTTPLHLLKEVYMSKIH